MFNSSFQRLCTQCFNQCTAKIYTSNKSVLSSKCVAGFVDVSWKRFVSGSAHLQMLDFTKMPTPRGLPLIGTALSLISAGGYTQLHEYVDRKHKELGPIFKDNVGPVTAVFLSDAEEMRKIFAKESKSFYSQFQMYCNNNRFFIKLNFQRY